MINIRKLIGALSFILAVFCFTAPSFSADKFIVNYDKTIDITDVPCQADVDGYTVKLDMSRPAKPFKTMVFKAKIYNGDEPADISKAHVLFNMAMDMGLYKAELAKAGKGYAAEIKLPRCIYGGNRWYAKVVFTAAGTEHQKVFVFDMRD